MNLTNKKVQKCACLEVSVVTKCAEAGNTQVFLQYQPVPACSRGGKKTCFRHNLKHCYMELSCLRQMRENIINVSLSPKTLM